MNNLQFQIFQIEAAIMDCVDEETGEILDFEKIQSLEMTREHKIEQLACLYKNTLAYAEKVKEEKQKLAEWQAKAEKQAEDIKNFLSGYLNGQKFKTPRVAISFRKSDKVNVLDLESVPSQYIRVKKEPDKKAIKEAIKSGEKVKGVELLEGKSISIK